MGPYIAVIDPDMERRLEQHAQSQLDETAAAAPEGVAVTTRVAWGSAADEILAAAEADAGLIVAGSRGYGTARRAVVGSVSGALLTQSKVPVLVTPRVAARELRAAA
jgi:nucleotide-binding universal stress UspA family protein